MAQQNFHKKEDPSFEIEISKYKYSIVKIVFINKKY